MDTDSRAEPAGGATALEERRRGIDRINRTIVALLAERQRLDGEIGTLQREHAAADAAYQGAPGAFSEEAALALVGAGARLEPSWPGARVRPSCRSKTRWRDRCRAAPTRSCGATCTSPANAS